MKRRILIILLCGALVALPVPCTTGAAGAPLNFVAVNDTLPQELINAAAYYGGIIYVPSWLIKNYNLGINYSYFTGSTTAYLESGDKQLFFNVTTGKTFDGDDYQYSVPAIVQGGIVYLPLSFLCSFFGSFSYANIGGNEYGNVLRIYAGSSELTDKEFLAAAKPAMKRQYDAYYKENTEGTGSETDGGKQQHQGETVRLGLVGLPEDETLELLRNTGMTACFFLREEELRSDPDRVRCIACRGFGLGVVCETGTAAEYEAAAELLWEICRVPCTMALVPAGAEPVSGATSRTLPEERETGGDRMAKTYAVTAELDAGHGDTELLFSCGAEHSTALKVLVYYLRDQGFAVRALRETDRE